jgi:hypothetical protein
MVPLIISAGAAIIFGAGISEACQLNKAIAASAEKVGILATHAGMLVRAVLAFLLLHVVIFIGLSVVAYFLFKYGAVPYLRPNCTQ